MLVSQYFIVVGHNLELVPNLIESRLEMPLGFSEFNKFIVQQSQFNLKRAILFGHLFQRTLSRRIIRPTHVAMIALILKHFVLEKDQLRRQIKVLLFLLLDFLVLIAQGIRDHSQFLQVLVLQSHLNDQTLFYLLQ